MSRYGKPNYVAYYDNLDAELEALLIGQKIVDVALGVTVHA